MVSEQNKNIYIFTRNFKFSNVYKNMYRKLVI